jgi:hypothetical protein
MLQQFSKIFLVLFIFGGIFFSCTEDDDPTPVDPDPADTVVVVPPDTTGTGDTTTTGDTTVVEPEPVPTAITVTGSDYAQIAKVGAQTTTNTLDLREFTEPLAVGENQVWDLREYASSGFSTNVGLENLPVPDGTSFTSATFVRTRPSPFLEAFTLTTFYEVSEEGYFVVGSKVNAGSAELAVGGTVTSDGSEIPQSDKEVVFKFPATYNQTAQSESIIEENYLLTAPAFGLNNAPVQRKLTETTTMEVVGWGKVILPQEGITDSTEVLLIASTGTIVNNYFLNGNTAPDALLNALDLIEGETNTVVFYYFLSKESGVVAAVGFEINESGVVQFPAFLAQYTTSHTK